LGSAIDLGCAIHLGCSGFDKRESGGLGLAIDLGRFRRKFDSVDLGSTVYLGRRIANI